VCVYIYIYIYICVYLYMLDENLLGLMMVSTLLKIVESRLFELWILCRCVCIYVCIYILCRCVCVYICIYILDENLRGLMMGGTLLKIMESRLFDLWILCRCVLYIYIYVCVYIYIYIYIYIE